MKKDIEDVCNLPDFPGDADGSSSDDEVHSMNKPAMQLVAEIRSNPDFKVKKHYSNRNYLDKAINELHKQKMTIPKESKRIRS